MTTKLGENGGKKGNFVEPLLLLLCFLFDYHKFNSLSRERKNCGEDARQKKEKYKWRQSRKKSFVRESNKKICAGWKVNLGAFPQVDCVR